jgi:hypothetical protein
MTVSAHSQAILLLTAHFSAPSKDDVRLLGPAGWGRFEAWLKNRALPPE